MQLSQQQQDYLKKLGITPWQSRNNSAKDANQKNEQVAVVSSTQQQPEPEAPSALQAEETPVQVVTRQEVEWLILAPNTEFPDWWEKFMLLFDGKAVVAGSTEGFDYQYGLIFDDKYSTVRVENSVICAPALASFGKHPELKKELWLTLKQWL